MMKSQKGITMPLVILIIAVVFIIASLTLTKSINSTINVSNTVTKEKTLQIAEAGYNHYMYYLDKDPNFHKNRSGISISGGNPSEELGFVPSKFDTNSLPLEYETTTYLDEDGEIIGYYKIRVNQPAVNKDLEVISTGWTYENPNIKSTVSVKFYNKNYLNHLYFTNTDANFIRESHTVEGSIFSNDNITVNRVAAFEADVISAGSISDNRNSIKGKKIEYQPKMNYPESNSEIIELGKSSEGLYYYGRTSILLNNGRIRIKNRYNDNITYDLPIPQSGVIVVEGEPVFISGVLDGRLTVYCTEDIYITGKDPTNYDPQKATTTFGVKYKDMNYIPGKNYTGGRLSDDMLGLISEKNIILTTVSWPEKSLITKRYDKSDVFVDDMTICGVLRSANDFIIEPSSGISGSLRVIGSIVCNTNGFSGYSHPSNYFVNSEYDYRLTNDFPPHILRPKDMVWVLKSWEEIPNP